MHLNLENITATVCTMAPIRIDVIALKRGGQPSVPEVNYTGDVQNVDSCAVRVELMVPEIPQKLVANFFSHLRVSTPFFFAAELRLDLTTAPVSLKLNIGARVRNNTSAYHRYTEVTELMCKCSSVCGYGLHLFAVKQQGGMRRQHLD